MQEDDLSHVLGRVEHTMQGLRQAFGPLGAHAWPVIHALLRAQLEQRHVSVTALADAAGGPRSTTRRTIFALKQHGLLQFQRMSPSGQRFQVLATRRLLDAIGKLGEFLLENDIAGDTQTNAMTTADQPIAWPQPCATGFDRHAGLQLLAYADPVFDIIKKHRAEIELFLGCTLEVISYPQSQYRHALQQALRDGGKTARLVALPFPWLAECQAHGQLARLDRHLAGSSALAASEFYEDIWATGTLRGHVYGIPLQPTVEFLWCRQDLLDAHGMAPPRSFTELHACAQALHAPKRGRWGIAWNAASGVPLAESFLQVLAAQVGDARASDAWKYESVLATATYLRSLVGCSPPNLRKLDWARSARLFGRGEAAFCYGWSNRHGHLETSELIQGGARVLALEHPTIDGTPGYSPLGGALLAMPAAMPGKLMERAWRAIETFASPQLGKYFVLHGAAGHARFAIARDRYVRQRNRLIEQMDVLAKHDRLARPAGHGSSHYVALIQTLSHHLERLLFGPDQPPESGVREIIAALRQSSRR